MTAAARIARQAARVPLRRDRIATARKRRDLVNRISQVPISQIGLPADNRPPGPRNLRNPASGNRTQAIARKANPDNAKADNTVRSLASQTRDQVNTVRRSRVSRNLANRGSMAPGRRSPGSSTLPT